MTLPNAAKIPTALRAITAAAVFVFTTSRVNHVMGMETVMMGSRVEKDAVSLTLARATVTRDAPRVRFASAVSVVLAAERTPSVLKENSALMVSAFLAARKTANALKEEIV